MFLAVVAVILGLALLVWSADKFVDGAASVARYYGMPALLIGMVIVGFGTSAPELVVSAIASIQGNAGLALGNAIGSNITNISLILGLTALLSPIAVHSQVLRKELPILTLVSFLTIILLWDLQISRIDGMILLFVFSLFLSWSIWTGLRQKKDALATEMEEELSGDQYTISLKKAYFLLSIGLVLLIVSSRMLVWGAVAIAHSFGVSDLIIGLTVVAVGTSLPELASSIIATRKGEHDIALGNVIGSNLFNTLGVIGLAGVIHPLSVESAVLTRDLSIMTILTVSLFIFGYGFSGAGKGRITRLNGGILLASYIAYTFYLIQNSF